MLEIAVEKIEIFGLKKKQNQTCFIFFKKVEWMAGENKKP